MGVFNRLGYTFDSTKFGDGNSFTAGQALLLNSTPSIKAWQADDLSNVSVTGYYQNPHSANLTILTTLVNQIKANSNTSNITFTTASARANVLSANANTLLIEISSFTDHTNRISGVTPSSNVANTPDYQSAITIGRQVLTIVNQIDGVQNNAPLLGNFTSLAIGGDISNTITLLTRDLATLNTSISGGTSSISNTTMNTIILDVQSAYSLLNGRRTGDVNFYVNSLYLVNDYNNVSQFDNIGVNSNYLINTLNIGTDKLKNNLQTSTVVPTIVNSSTTTTSTTTSTSTYSSVSPGLSPTGVSAGTYAAPSNLIVDAYGRITSIASQIPSVTGEIKMWPIATPPTGYLICDGSAVSRSTYSALFTIVGTTFGVGNGSSTFNLPDFRDRMPIGAGSTYSANTFGGSADAIVVSHTHTASTSISDPGHFHSTTWNNVNDFNQGGQAPGAEQYPDDTQGTFGINTDTKGTGISATTTVVANGSSPTNANLPPYRGIYFIINHV
jgi:microcystin-dependent protein